MGLSEEQATEVEVLKSIFEGDDRFSEVEENKFQYKLGEDGHFQSFILEIVWPESYPETSPVINLDLFYNRHLFPQVKETITSSLMTEAEPYLGMAVTFTLIEYAKEHFDELVKEQTEVIDEVSNLKIDSSANAKITENKAEMTKAQKRRMWDRTNATQFGTMERGFNWVDILRHLAQTRDS